MRYKYSFQQPGLNPASVTAGLHPASVTHTAGLNPASVTPNMTVGLSPASVTSFAEDFEEAKRPRHRRRRRRSFSVHIKKKFAVAYAENNHVTLKEARERHIPRHMMKRWALDLKLLSLKTKQTGGLSSNATLANQTGGLSESAISKDQLIQDLKMTVANLCLELELAGRRKVIKPRRVIYDSLQRIYCKEAIVQ